MKFIWKCSDNGDDVIHVGHAKVRWSAPNCDGLLLIGTQKSTVIIIYII